MRRVLLGVRDAQQGISDAIQALSLRQRPLQHGTTRASVRACRRASSMAFSFPSHSRSQAEAARRAAAEVTSQDPGVSGDPVFIRELREGIARTISAKTYVSETEPEYVDHPAPGSELYGKWRSLTLDHESLLTESDINVPDARLVRLVDQPGNETDIELWACLLEFCRRWMDRDGILMIWQAVFKRRNLYQVDGVLRQAFWRTILNAAVSSDAFLGQVVIYAEWLLETHGVRWPHLYLTTMSYMLAKRSEADVLRWHITLYPSFAPDEAEFVGLLKKFITNPDLDLQHTLQLLYTWSGQQRQLYDILIPHLYAEGQSKLAMQWRTYCITHGDVPFSLAARPCLRYMRAYYPNLKLTKEELSVAGLVMGEKKEQPPSQPLKTAIDGQNLRYLINRVHGETFGIQEKSYNDRLGAKWFASTWVPLDFAINVIYTMGVQTIGPLSLQSIALREANAEGVLHRLDQLGQLNIQLPKSNYVHAIRHYASVGDEEALQELLHSDIHPDIFDDNQAQQKLLGDCLLAKDWKTYRLILGTSLAVLSGSIATSSDHVLRFWARQRNGRKALTILKEMSSHNLSPHPLTSHILSILVLQKTPPHATGRRNTRQFDDLLVSLCRQLAATRFPPAVEVWQVLLYRLGREKRLHDLERLSFEVLGLFLDHAMSARPMFISHKADIPKILRYESPYRNFQKLPRDMPLENERHPLCQIFDQSLQNAIVRWGFTYTSYDPRAEAAAAAILNDDGSNATTTSPKAERTPADFHFARGIRLLAMLRDQGLPVLPMKVRKQAVLRLVDLYRGGDNSPDKWAGGQPGLAELRRRNGLSLAEAKRLCDEAWGSEVTPNLLDLTKVTKRAERPGRVRWTLGGYI